VKTIDPTLIVVRRLLVIEVRVANEQMIHELHLSQIFWVDFFDGARTRARDSSV
jgi:hypothetical protein